MNLDYGNNIEQYNESIKQVPETCTELKTRCVGSKNKEGVTCQVSLSFDL